MADDLSPRERRKARASKAGSIDYSGFRKLVVPLILLGLVGLVLFMVVRNETVSDNCPGHWHTTFGIFVEGERVDFEQPPYSLSGAEGGDLPISMHMHAPDDETMHIEPTRPKCTTVKAVFRLLGVNLDGNSMEIESKGHNIAGTFHENSTHPLRAWIGTFNATAYEETSNVAASFDYVEKDWDDFVRMGQLKDSTKVIITYGPVTAEEIAQFQSEVALPPAFRAQG